MKIALKSSKPAVKAVSQNVTSTAKVTGLHRRSNILQASAQHMIDGATAWLGTAIIAKVPETLIAMATKLHAHKLNKIEGKVLLVQGKKLYAWPLVGLQGDVYSRVHQGEKGSRRIEVRGSLKVLRDTYKSANVQIVTVEQALKKATSMKTDAGCLLLLKQAAA